MQKSTYPFGSLVPNRHATDGSYRYGFQGQEKDDEIKGEGNSLNYTFRMHDPRVGRFFAVDPLESKYPWYTPYQFSGNRPIDSIELEGLEEFKINKINGESGSIYGPYVNAEEAQLAYNSTIDVSKIKPKDDYEKAILEGRIFFAKNYGWVDKTHAFTETTRKDPHIGVQNLWRQIMNEPSKEKLHMGCYSVTYKQDILKGGMSIGVERQYAISAGLSLEEKKSVALTIFQDVSFQFEKLQSLHPTSSSSFEPADLPSNMLNFYRIVQSGMNTTKIKNLIQPLDAITSLIIYRSYPGTFTDKKFKNLSFTPLFFKTNFTLNNFSIPKELKSIKPAEKGKNLFLVDEDIIRRQ
ncbi:MAG: hypothetical protein J0L86_04995 [Flavobacteriales bacterium]|nr:hypothetical protein [Flavobacteriales bacterium]